MPLKGLSKTLPRSTVEIGVCFGSLFGSAGSQLEGTGIKSNHTKQLCNNFLVHLKNTVWASTT